MTSRRSFLGALLGAALAPTPVARAAGFGARGPITIHAAPGLLAVGTLLTISGIVDSRGAPVTFRVTGAASGGGATLSAVAADWTGLEASDDE